MAQSVTCQITMKETLTRQDQSQTAVVVAKYVGADTSIEGFVVRYNVTPGSALDLAYAKGDFINVTLDVGSPP